MRNSQISIPNPHHSPKVQLPAGSRGAERTPGSWKPAEVRGSGETRALLRPGVAGRDRGVGI